MWGKGSQGRDRGGGRNQIDGIDDCDDDLDDEHEDDGDGDDDCDDDLDDEYDHDGNDRMNLEAREMSHVSQIGLKDKADLKQKSY